MSPKKIYATLAKETSYTAIYLYPNNCGKIFISQVFGADPKTEIPMLTILKTKNPLSETMMVSLDTMNNQSGKTGNGGARKAMKTLIDLLEHHYPRINDMVISKTPDSDYVWTRFGFVPDIQTWDYIKERCAIRKKVIAPQLSRKTNRRIDEALASDDPKAIWVLADDKTEIGYAGTAERTTAGKHLLDSNGPAHLYLHDLETMARFNIYVGRAQNTAVLQTPDSTWATNPKITERGGSGGRGRGSNPRPNLD